MDKEKLASLVKYSNQLKDRLSSPVPEKWAHSPDSFRAFLSRELRMVDAKIDDAKFAVEPKAGK